MRAALAAALLASAVAHAGDPAATTTAPTPAMGKARLAPILPTFRLTGATDGSGLVQASIDLVLGVANDWDLAITPTFQGSGTSALPRLFPAPTTATPVDESAWFLGASLAAIKLGIDTSGERPGAGGAMDAVKKRAWDACMDACREPGATEEEQKFCADNVKRSPFEVDNARFCPRGIAIILEGDTIMREQRAAFPELILSAGAMVGSSHFRYFVIQNNQELQPQSSSEVNYTVAAAATWVRRKTGMTLEVPVVFGVYWLPSPLTLNLCDNAGNFVQNGMTISTGQTCDKTTLDGPHKTWRVFTTIQVGYVSRPSGFWRASIGPLLAYQDNGALQRFRTDAAGALFDRDTSLTVGFMAPIYLNFVTAPPAWIGDYKGLIRVTPTLQWVQLSDGWDTQFMITLSLLGQRTLFGRALDWP